MLGTSKIFLLWLFFDISFNRLTAAGNISRIITLNARKQSSILLPIVWRGGRYLGLLTTGGK